MLRGLLIYLLAFSIGFPPGSLPFAMAQTASKMGTSVTTKVNPEKIKRHEKLVNEVSSAAMDLTSMLMQQRFPESKPLAFQKAPTLGNLTNIQHTMIQWRDLLKEDWEDLLLSTEPMNQDGLNKMLSQAETLSLEMILYFQAQYLYLANLSFLTRPSPLQIQQLIANTQIQIPIENILNHQMFTQVFQKLIQPVSDIIDAGHTKTMSVKVDECANHMNCLNFSLSTAKAYRALESINQYKNDGDAFQHFSRLLILENYVSSYAKLDHYLNPSQNTLQLPKALITEHPSLPFLYDEVKNDMNEDQNFRFAEWLISKGKAQLIQLLNEMNQDPSINLANADFIKRYQDLLKAKAKNSPVLTTDRLNEIQQEVDGEYLSINLQNIAMITEAVDKQKKFKEDVWFDLFLVFKNQYVQSELLSDSQLDDTEKLSIHALIKKEYSAIKKKVDIKKYKSKIKALYEAFRESLKNEANENILAHIYETAEQLNLATYGLDYEALIYAIQQSRDYEFLHPSELISKRLNQIAESFKKDGLVENSKKIAELQLRFAKSYYETLHELLEFWTRIKKIPASDLSFNDLISIVDQEKKAIPGYYENINIYRIEKDLHDWLKIGELFKVHNGQEMISDSLAAALKKTEEELTDDEEVKDFKFDAQALKVYQDILEEKLSSHFPLLSAKSSSVKIMKGMGSDRKEYDIPVTLPEQALWKHLKNKSYAEAKPMIINQLQTSRSYIQKQVNNLADEMNAKTSLLTRIKTEMGFSRFDELNGQIPETLALHLAYSSVLTQELKGYEMGDKLKQFRQQKMGVSNFQAALDRVIQYTSIYYIAMIGVQLANWAAFSRVPFLKKILPSFAKTSRASSMMSRDGLSGVAAKWRGQPITLFGMPQSWMDLGFWGGLTLSSGINLGNAIDGLNTDVPFLEEAYTNQVSCSEKSPYDLYSKQGCQIADKNIIEAQKMTYASAIAKTALSVGAMTGILYGLPKIMAYAQRIQTRIRMQNSNKHHEALERLLQDVGFSQGTKVSFNTKDIRAVTYDILKHFYRKTSVVGSSAKRDLAERIFLLTRYLQLKEMIQLETSFWRTVDNALAVHWKRLGITPTSKDWSQRFDPQFINATAENLRIHFASGRVSVRQYEALTQDIQVISSALNPAWKLMKDAGNGRAGNYAQLVRYAMDVRIGAPQRLPVVQAFEVQRMKQYSALFVRGEINSKRQIAIVRLTPYEMSTQAKALAEKLKKQHLQELLNMKIKNMRGFDL